MAPMRHFCSGNFQIQVRDFTCNCNVFYFDNFFKMESVDYKDLLFKVEKNASPHNTKINLISVLYGYLLVSQKLGKKYESISKIQSIMKIN